MSSEEGATPRRVYGKTQVTGLNWSCPDCGCVVEFFNGRPIHDRWHDELEKWLRGLR